jgi:putative ABC transport system substrate-binding protein
MGPVRDGTQIDRHPRQIRSHAIPKSTKAAPQHSSERAAIPVTMRASESIARSLNVSLEFGEFDIDTAETAISAIAARGVQGLVYSADGVSISRRKEIADRAISHKLPTIFALRQNVDAGGFLSYAARLSDLSRRAAFFVDRILKGEKPGDLPIEQPTTFELIINLRTAKALGVTPPPALLAIADEVIE